jgi:predicted ATPase with chaperone activity
MMKMPLASPKADADLDGLFDRLTKLADDAGSAGSRKAASAPVDEVDHVRFVARDDELASAESGGSCSQPVSANDSFFPMAPRSLAETAISDNEIEAIVLRCLTLQGSMNGAEIAGQIGLPFTVIEKFLHTMKAQRLLAHKNAAALSDFTYEITEAGANKLRHGGSHCTYCGAVPVSLDEYQASVAAQSLTKLEPQPEDLKRAFADLTISDEMLRRLGLAIAAGKGLFLYGQPGNGKTSVAERITAVFGSSIWVPRAVSVWGEIVRLYDPSCHEELPLARGDQLLDDEKVDHRWVRIRRPTIVVGGELTLDSLEVTVNKTTGVAEAPLQMKSNGGSLVIDDFGRQRIAPAELLNRWIVPLEKRHDFLLLASGRKFLVPFDQLIIFSTNLEPKDLVDEAFLRRIPYKIEIENPTVEQFRSLFEGTCKKMGLEFDEPALDHLLVTHYQRAGRELRFCHPRDLLQQVAIYSKFYRAQRTASVEAIDIAARNYFSTTG